MTAVHREKEYIRKWRPKAVRGITHAMSNVAAAYRILGNFRLAARWYKRAAEQGDGDALTDWVTAFSMALALERMTGPQSEHIALPLTPSGSLTTAARRQCIISRFSSSADRLRLRAMPPLDSCELPVLTGTTPRPRPSFGS